MLLVIFKGFVSPLIYLLLPSVSLIALCLASDAIIINSSNKPLIFS